MKALQEEKKVLREQVEFVPCHVALQTLEIYKAPVGYVNLLVGLGELHQEIITEALLQLLDFKQM